MSKTLFAIVHDGESTNVEIAAEEIEDYVRIATVVVATIKMNPSLRTAFLAVMDSLKERPEMFEAITNNAKKIEVPVNKNKTVS